MRFFEFAALAFVIIGIVTLVKTVLEHRRLGRKASLQDAERVEMEAKIVALEERVKVLEAIVTDQSYDLKKKINAL